MIMLNQKIKNTFSNFVSYDPLVKKDSSKKNFDNLNVVIEEIINNNVFLFFFIIKLNFMYNHFFYTLLPDTSI